LTFDPLGSNTKGVCAQPYKGVLWLGKNERAAYVCRERSNYLFDRPICGGIDNVASKANCKHSAVIIYAEYFSSTLVCVQVLGKIK